MAKYEIRLSRGINEVVRRAESAISSSGLSVELVDESVLSVNGVTINVMVFEKYYMRTANRATVTITAVGDENSTFLSAIGAGGGSDSLFRFDWGVEDSIISPIIREFEE